MNRNVRTVFFLAIEHKVVVEFEVWHFINFSAANQNNWAFALGRNLYVFNINDREFVRKFLKFFQRKLMRCFEQYMVEATWLFKFKMDVWFFEILKYLTVNILFDFLFKSS